MSMKEIDSAAETAKAHKRLRGRVFTFHKST
jgi:hypothetical protein